ncbi:MAG TPA: dienelactone hydrolase family protein [Bacteroidia bacterium]|jgi:carboxymethylenebutenolidase|nr:dienelactone hydrolase family protein [Bacteroidia bacterium]
MKKIIILAFALISVRSIAQVNCCSKPSTEIFAMLIHDKKFVGSHLEPTPFTLANPIGKEITFKTTDGKEGYGYEIKAEKYTENYVLVIHEWWGLNDYIKQEAEKIFKTLGNVNVIAIDLYDKKVAATRDSAGKYMQSVKKERAEVIIKGVLNHAGEKANIATIGWCFGGGWSLQASMLAGAHARACVMYYGMPEESQEKLENLFCPVQFVWPEQDQWINKNVVTKFEATMARAKKSLEVKKYNADHAFANPSNPKYNKEFADDAFKNAMAFIKKHLK